MPDGAEQLGVALPFAQQLIGRLLPDVVEELQQPCDLAALRRRLVWAGAAAQHEDRGEAGGVDADRLAGDGEAFTAALEEQAADEPRTDAGDLRKQRLEERDLAAPQRLHEKIPVDALLLGE